MTCIAEGRKAVCLRSSATSLASGAASIRREISNGLSNVSATGICAAACRLAANCRSFRLATGVRYNGRAGNVSNFGLRR